MKTAEGLQVEPKDCLVFEDVPMGIMAGKNTRYAGMRCGGCYSKRQEADKRRLADYYIEDYYEVLNL